MTVHQNHLRGVALEMFKVKMGCSPTFMKNIFQSSTPTYKLRTVTEFSSSYPQTVRYGTECISFMGPKTWSLLPSHIANLTNTFDFKRKVKEWIPEGCRCRLCKVYVADIGFM